MTQPKCGSMSPSTWISMRKLCPCRRAHLWPSGTLGSRCAASSVKALKIFMREVYRRAVAAAMRRSGPRGHPVLESPASRNEGNPMPTLMRAAVLFLASAFAVNAAPAPRERVDAVADAIATNYFDAARGKSIADDLRRDASGGAFDALSPQALADTLTQRLRPLDRHFRVRWNGESAAPAPTAGPRRPP